ncbi:MAG TPA: dethiobiotin synthase [Planctomycetota bacterium]
MGSRLDGSPLDGSSLDRELAADLERRAADGLRRDARLGGRIDGVDLGSNDTLGLARHPRVVAAARAALEEHGAGGRAARLLRGGSPLDERAEAAMAEWLGAEAALLFPSGFQANLGLLGALAGRGDALFSDRLNHASLVDGARLSRAHVLVHAHGDLEELGRQLAQARGARRRLVVAESIFGMDGDAAHLSELDELCARHDAWLVIDEAHALGVVGPRGAGAWAALGRGPDTRLAARVVTGGKALGVAGAFVVGSRILREQLVNHARALLFTTASPPPVAGGLLAAIELARDMESERAHLRGLATELARRLGLPAPAGAIVPFPCASPRQALELAQRLEARGLFVPAVRPPTVPANGSRLRVVCHAFNTASELDELTRALAALPAQPAPRAASEPPGSALFVVGTDTGVGKTVVSALLLRAARALGRAAYWKPVQTGDESDRAAVLALAEASEHEGLPNAWSFPLPASPHEAAAAAGKAIEPGRLGEGLRGLVRTLTGTRIVVELAGGLLVPYRSEPELVTQADWLAVAGTPLVLVARAGLGTLNHTLLTLEALRARHLEPRALFLVGTPHASNRRTLAQVTHVPRVYELPVLEPLAPAALAGWLEQNDLGPLFTP